MEYPKTLHKKGGVFSTRHKGVRVSYSVVTAVDDVHEKKLKKEGWQSGLDDALNPPVKKQTKKKKTKTKADETDDAGEDKKTEANK